MGFEIITELEGKTFTNVAVFEWAGEAYVQTTKHGVGQSSELRFYLPDGSYYKFYHEQDCCESVYIESITGDLSDLIGTPLLMAQRRYDLPTSDATDVYMEESYTWSFYCFGTIKGFVDVRWFGSSNGYYSESVDFEHVTP